MTQRRRVRVAPGGLVGRVLVPEPLHVRPVDDELGAGVLVVGLPVQVAVDDRVNQHLQRGQWSASMEQPQRGDRREVPACAVPGDHHRLARPELGGRDPRERVVGVIGRRREHVLGREPVVNRHQRAPGGHRQGAAHRVPVVNRPDHPPAAVVVHDRRRGARSGRIHPRRDVARLPGDEHVPDRGHQRPGPDELPHRPEPRPVLLRCQLPHRRRPRGPPPVQNRLRLRADRRARGHRRLLCSRISSLKKTHRALYASANPVYSLAATASHLSR
jgi:hypothetical protein